MAVTRNHSTVHTCFWILVTLAVTLHCGGAPETETAAPPATEPGEPSAPATEPGPAPATGSGAITGKIVYEGAVPNLKAVDMSADPQCAAKHTEPVATEILVLGEDRSLANVFVSVTGGLPDGKWPTPSEPVVLDQNGCRYSPRVMGVMVGQPFKILNSDGILHNVHALPKVNKQFNMAMPASRTEAVESFNSVEDIFTIKCDVHPWMRAFVAVSSHPFFSVTGEDGIFSIEGLPAGEYEIEAWHEKLGTKTASVSVSDGATASVDLTFSR